MKSLDKVAAKAKRSSASACRRRPRQARRRPAHKRRTRLSKPAIEEMFRRFEAADPDPKSELEYVNPFTLLVAVVLSAQATDAGVNKATRALFKIADTPEKMVRLGEDSVRDFIKTIGLYRNKARNVIELSRQLIANHGGDVPRDRDALEALPGVGRKTANVVLNVAFGEPTMAVDTHVFRVANRTGLSSGRDAAGGGGGSAACRAAEIRNARAPLADPARALRVQGAAAGMPAMPHPRPLPFRGENTVRLSEVSGATQKVIPTNDGGIRPPLMSCFATRRDKPAFAGQLLVGSRCSHLITAILGFAPNARNGLSHRIRMQRIVRVDGPPTFVVWRGTIFDVQQSRI